HTRSKRDWSSDVCSSDLFYRNGVVVTRKEDTSPLTLADRASHDFLTESLRSILPDTIVISEESAEAERRPRAEAERFWLVDPLRSEEHTSELQSRFDLVC